MSEPDKDLVIQGLIESNEILQEVSDRYRNNNRVLRTVVSSLRTSVTRMREQLEIAKKNDEIFKSYCQGDFDVPTSQVAEGGLPDATGTVEPLV